MSRADAIKYYTKNKNKFKLENLDRIKENEIITFYKNDDFDDSRYFHF